MATSGYSLLKRNHTMTREEFSVHWEKKHAPLVIPWALQYGVEYYAQASQNRKFAHDLRTLHSPRLAPNTPPLPGLVIEDYDGAAQMRMPSQETMLKAFKDPYYLNVILLDERRFLVSEAKLHVKVVPFDSIVGVKKVVIDGEKPPVEDKETRDGRLETLEAWKEMWGGTCG